MRSEAPGMRSDLLRPPLPLRERAGVRVVTHRFSRGRFARRAVFENLDVPTLTRPRGLGHPLPERERGQGNRAGRAIIVAAGSRRKLLVSCVIAESLFRFQSHLRVKLHHFLRQHDLRGDQLVHAVEPDHRAARILFVRRCQLDDG